MLSNRQVLIITLSKHCDVMQRREIAKAVNSLSDKELALYLARFKPDFFGRLTYSPIKNITLELKNLRDNLLNNFGV